MANLILSPPHYSGFRFSQLVRFSADPFRFLREAYQECGDVFQLNLPVFGKIVCVACPHLVREIAAQPDEIYSAGHFHHMITGGLLGKSSTFTADGKAHHQRQKLIFKHFNNRDSIHNVGIIRSALSRQLKVHRKGDIVNLCDLFDRLSLEVVGRILWGKATEDERLSQLLDEFHQFSTMALRSILCQIPKLQHDLGSWSPWGRILRQERKIRQIYHQELQRLRIEGYDRASMIGHLFENGLNNEAIIEEIFTLLFGGHETTSAVMAWVVYQVATHAEVKTHLLNEIYSVLGERPVEPKDLPEMPLATAIVDETIRISPIGPFSGGRISRQDVELSGYLIQADTPILFCPFTIAEREDIWQDASRFDPTRFMDRANHNLSSQVAFGYGNRVCVGKMLAKLEITVMLVSLFQGTDLELVSYGVKPERRGLAWVPSQNLSARIIKHSES